MHEPNGRGYVMHEPKASALRNRDRYCIIRVRQIKTLMVSVLFTVDHVIFSQSGSGFIVAESFKRLSIRESRCCVNGSKRQLYVVLLLV